MNRAVNSISGRLSLRPPQRQSLEILARLAEILPLAKDQDVRACLEIVRSEFPSVEEFERDFPSVCLALATGVGKTRLMGAAIAYLAKERGLRHFLVLAPNLTIYEKLKADFTPNTPKYVFQGLAEFASNPPEVVTGDDYDSGKSLFRNLEEGVHINVFNISKINSEVRGGSSPRIRRLSEYIGTSYFDYLASLEDLVLVMDESHRYRASAGVKAINELRPVLGVELTATPKASGVGGATFKNIIYSYPLSEAMKDGFVKEPAVVTKENFRPQDYSDAELEIVKLEDGVRVHENAKVELETYRLQNDRPAVHPFMLVVAQDVAHAEEVERLIKSERFFEGRYADKVITVHSNQSGELKDEVVARLLKVESAQDASAPEIVIHVNKLGEGWDVTNLYTIVPLKRFAADILTEQTLGRGLRLPYGRRTGVDAVDTLNIVAHDKFQAIIDAARNPNSIIKKGVVIGRDIPIERRIAVTVQPSFAPEVAKAGETPRQGALVFKTEQEKKVAEVAVEVVRQFEYLPRSADLKRPEVKAQFVAEVKRALAAYGTKPQESLEGLAEPAMVAEVVDVERIVEQVTAKVVDLTIDIPRIVLQPKGETVLRFNDFDLDVSGVSLQPVAQDLLVQALSTDKRWKLSGGAPIQLEARLEDYLVRGLIEKPDVDYGEHADLLYKLAGQMVARLHSYLQGDDRVLNVLAYHQTPLVNAIHAQMQAHRWEAPTEYEVHVSKGFTTLRSTSFDALASEMARDFRQPVEQRLLIRGMSFKGFERCLYPVQKFQVDAERHLAVVLENDKTVLKWFKPAPTQFRIHVRDGNYEPDFVVETGEAKYLIEPKRADLVNDADVLMKADAAVRWCEHASDHERANGGKPWTYLLVPDTAINESMSLAGLVASYARGRVAA